MLNQEILLKLLSSNSKAYYDLLIDRNFNNAINSLDQNSIVLDIGANIGNVSSYIIEKTKSNWSSEKGYLSSALCKNTLLFISSLQLFTAYSEESIPVTFKSGKINFIS